MIPIKSYRDLSSLPRRQLRKYWSCTTTRFLDKPTAPSGATEDDVMKAKDVKGIEGKALDWALNYALMLENGFVPEIAGAAGAPSELYSHTDPAVCLWLIKQYRANIDHTEHAPQIEVSIWYALTDEADPDFDCQSVIGDTVEQAVARCVIAMKLGEEFEVPDELGVVL